MMKLDNRMYAILSHVDKCRVVADIGTDHGYISASIAERGLADTIIASDISEKSLLKAAKLIKNEGIMNVELRVGSGTSVLQDNECDTLIIAGMGGALIANILAAESRSFNKYILSPQRDQDILRKFMSDNNIVPLNDYKVESLGRFYDIIVAEKGKYLPLESELFFGSGFGIDFVKFRYYEIARLQAIISMASGDKLKFNQKKLNLLNKLVKNHNND